MPKGIPKNGINKGWFKKGRVIPEEIRMVMNKDKVGKKRPKFSKEWLDNLSKAHKGKKFSNETKEKMALAKTGSKNLKWKGEEVKYRALHMWVEKKLGKPKKCEDCGDDSLKHRQYHWANISRNYLRVTTDWRRLCVKCHMVFDGRVKSGKKLKQLT